MTDGDERTEKACVDLHVYPNIVDVIAARTPKQFPFAVGQWQKLV